MDSKKLDSYVNPKHYAKYIIDVKPIEFVEELPFNLASACKYLFRLGKKDNAEIEIGKIKWYLSRALERDEYAKVPKYLIKLAPIGADLNIAIINAIAAGKEHLVHELCHHLVKEYVDKSASNEVEEPKETERTLRKSDRIINLRIDNDYYFKLSKDGLLFSYAPIEEGNEEVNKVDLNTLLKNTYDNLNKFLDDSQVPDEEEIITTFREIISLLKKEEETYEPEF